MPNNQVPRPPIDLEAVRRLREELRERIRAAPPPADPLLRELQQNIEAGVRGRDLLGLGVYRERFAAMANELTEHLCQLRDEAEEQARRERD
ncbi:hypothetical protein [Actinoplanes sp. NPDC051851]|uniref:hypothetical protein n=1 Tax=Actinoplanes sp. NPDC051851 TaxID=3154753 RepID=UPI003430474E